jgi:glycosyltransferase involved in cell wall biosynthesis
MRAGPDWIKPVLDVLMIPFLRKERPDVIHVHNYEAPLVAKMANMLRRSSIPIVYSAHNLMEEELPSYFKGRRSQKLMSHFGRILDRNVPQMTEHCVVLSEVGMKKLKELGCKNISLIYPGVAASEFEDVIPQELPEGRWVIYAGNPDQYQDLDILMEAMSFLPEVGLVMVSASDTRKWKRKGKGRTLHIQTQNFKEVCGYLEKAHVGVLPRVQCSGFPIKVLNYLAMGLPVVCSEGSKIDVPSVFSVPNHSPEKMAKKISWLLSEEDRRLVIGLDGRNFVFKELSWKKQAERLEKIYQAEIRDMKNKYRKKDKFLL